MKKYEVMYILKANLDDATRNELIGKLNNYLTVDGGTIDNVNEWGLRELAYEINKSTTGYYFLYVVEAEAATVKEFEDNIRIEYKREQAINDYIEKNISDKEVENYYNTYTSGEITASHILIKSDAKSTDSAEKQKWNNCYVYLRLQLSAVGAEHCAVGVV